ncbi:type 4 pilus major pilin [Pantoea sp. DY-5]|uniref:type 4 pilus major pilin n=1 Tax=Pantoea sp. DY-5 TaxID=2871488 RepID=UPI001C956F56|nr:type 4 pilus major pilin [Pantoea sp. DY-5]MBY4841133.1 prepilin [Pantoea sp. DY-5]
MSILKKKTISAVHRGAFNLTEAAIVGVLVLLAIIYYISSGNSQFSRADYTEEITNASDIMTNTRGQMKTAGSYQFSSSSDMTGALIKFGGVPGTIAVNGTKSSGSATLTNRWNGSITVEPVSTGGGSNTSFALTYTQVPMEACTQMSQKLSGANNVASTSINGSTTSGPVSAAVAASQCTADSGSTGTNTLVFTSNT